MAAAWLIFSFGILFLGQKVYHLDLIQLQTLIFVMLVFSGLANVYLVHERGPFWKSRPGTPLLLSYNRRYLRCKLVGRTRHFDGTDQHHTHCDPGWTYPGLCAGSGSFQGCRISTNGISEIITAFFTNLLSLHFMNFIKPIVRQAVPQTGLL